MHASLQLKVVVTIASGIGNPLQFFFGRFGSCVGAGRRVDDASGECNVDADDVGFTRCNRQHLLTATADKERNLGLQWLRRSFVAGDVVVRAVKVNGTVCEQALDDSDGLVHAINANARSIKWNAGLFVIGGHPTGTDTELETTTTQQVDSRCFLSENHWVAIIVAPHQGADLQR